MEKTRNNGKIIFHIDLNAFFCSVAEIFNPALRNTAFAIGRENSNYGVISTASYEARKYGIHSGMSLKEAFSLLPNLNIVSLPYSKYLEYHNLFINFLGQYTKYIEVASIDEAYLDMTEASLKRHPLVLAKEMQTRLLKEYRLSSSIGIAPTLFLAKMGSDYKKPLGITVIRKREASAILGPLSVKAIYGIGKKTYPKLIENNILTISDFLNPLNEETILKVMSLEYYNETLNCLKGNSRNYIDLERNKNSESISTMKTFDRRLNSEDEILYELRLLAKDIHTKLKKEGYLAKTVSITLRDINFKTITRSKTLDYSDEFYYLFDIATDLFLDNFKGEYLRLIGIGFSNLIKKDEIEEEYNLFSNLDKKEKTERISLMIQKFKARFGSYSLFFGKDSKNLTTSSTNKDGVDAPEVMETLFTKVKS